MSGPNSESNTCWFVWTPAECLALPCLMGLEAELACNAHLASEAQAAELVADVVKSTRKCRQKLRRISSVRSLGERQTLTERASIVWVSVREEAREGEKRGHIQGQKMELYPGDWHEWFHTMSHVMAACAEDLWAARNSWRLRREWGTKGWWCPCRPFLAGMFENDSLSNVEGQTRLKWKGRSD